MHKVLAFNPSLKSSKLVSIAVLRVTKLVKCDAVAVSSTVEIIISELSKKNRLHLKQTEQLKQIGRFA